MSNPSLSKPPQKASLSPRLSDSDVFSPASSHSAANSLNPSPQSLRLLSNGEHSVEDEAEESRSRDSTGGRSQIRSEGDGSVFEEDSHLNGGEGEGAFGGVFEFQAVESGDEQPHDDKVVEEDSRVSRGSVSGHKAGKSDPPPLLPPPPHHLSDASEENALIPMTLYMHRVKGLVLALLVEPHFMSDATSMEEVVRAVFCFSSANCSSI